MGVAGPIIAAAATIGSSAISGYKAGKVVGEAIGETIRDKILTLKNKHRHRIWAVVMYKNNYIEDWMVKGWFEILPFDSFSYSFPGVKNRVVYYYAQCEECGRTWGNGDTTGYVPTSNEAFTHYNSSCFGTLRDFSKVNLSKNDVERSLTGY